MTKYHEWPDYRIKLLVGGCPCQAFSVAGLREGLNDPRGNLTLTFLGVAAKYKPKWIVYENVPGILSDKTDAFGCLIAGLVELGYGVAWRIHDAQYAGLAQRRKRVFVVACLGDWASASEVLFEPDCLRWNPPPSREARQEVTGTLSARTEGGGGLGTDFGLGGGLVSHALRAQAQSAHDFTMETYVPERAHALCARMAKGGDPTTDNYVAHTLRASGFDASEDGTGRGTPLVAFNWNAQVDQMNFDANTTPPLTCSQGAAIGPLSFAQNQAGEVRVSDITNTLNTNSNASGRNAPLAHVNMAVRRLTPTECERLQGFTSVIERAEIRVCLDHQKGSVSAEVKCLRWLNSVWRAEGKGRSDHARFADADSLKSRVGQNAHAVACVRMSSEPEVQALLSAGRFHLFASGAENQNLCRQFMPLENIVRALAQLGQEAVRSVRYGEVESLPNMINFTPQESGNLRAAMFGRGSAGNAKDAEVNPLASTKFTTSKEDQKSPILSSSERISLCSALIAIASFIPEKTLAGNFVDIVFEFERDWTNIPWRGKETSPDGPRYKALGNSMAVPCMKWIGKRIAAVDARRTGTIEFD